MEGTHQYSILRLPVSDGREFRTRTRRTPAWLSNEGCPLWVFLALDELCLAEAKNYVVPATFAIFASCLFRGRYVVSGIGAFPISS